MAIKTNNYSKSGSYSKPSTTTKAKSSSKSNSTAKNSSSTSKSTVNSSQKRDTFTSSSAKVQKTSKTTQSTKTSSSKTSNSGKTTVKSTSTVNNSSKTATSSKNSVQSKSNRDTFTYSSKTTATKSKTTLTASKTSSGSLKRDTFSCSAKMENLTRIAKTSVNTTQNSNTVQDNKTNVSSKSNTVVNTAKQGAAVGVNVAKSDTQAKSTPTKNNNTVTNKLATVSSKSKILESIQNQYEHTTDLKQKEAMKKTMNDIASGVSSKSDSVEKKLEELGIDLSTLTFMSDGSKYGAKIIDNGQSYNFVLEGDTRLHECGYMTKQDYEKILYIVAHEVGNEAINSTEKFATASALLNQLEQYWGNGDTIADSLDNFYKYNSCINDGGIINIQHKQCIYSREEETKALKNNVTNEVNLALQGIRAFDKEIQSWLALGDGLHGKYGTNLDVGGVYIVNEKNNK